MSGAGVGESGFADDVMARARRAKLARAALARGDGAAFCEFVLKDREGKPIRLARMHRAWQALCERHDRLIVWSFVEGGKSSGLVVGRLLYEIQRDPNIRTALVSNTADMSVKTVKAVARYVERDPEFRLVAPNVEPAEPWTSTQLFVRREGLGRDPTLQACGVHGNILGARIDLLILDDVLDYENTRTAAAREDLWKWYHATLAGRLTAAARVVVVGNAWHPEDLLARLSKEPMWAAYRFPVLKGDMTSNWPEVWPPQRISRKREELGPLEFARQMMCVARDDAQARFRRDWIDLCLARGSGERVVHRLEGGPPKGARAFTGVDLAVSRKDSAGLTVFFSGLLLPNGDRKVLCIESGRFGGPEIVSKLKDHRARYGSVCVVEGNAAQEFLNQFARKEVPVVSFTTGRNKMHPEYGVEGIANELASGKWIIPSGGGTLDREVDAWIQEMLYYDPSAHTGDRLMASWFFREGCELGKRAGKAKWARVDV